VSFIELPRIRRERAALGLCAGLLSVAFALVGTGVTPADDDSTPATGDADARSTPEPARAPETRAEIERELDLRTRDREQLRIRIGDAEPTEKQQQQLDSLDRTIAELQRSLAKVQQAAAAKVEQAEGSVKGRWLKLREALQDVTRYDMKDGMFRLRMGVRLQIDATLAFEDDRLEADIGSISNGLDFRRARIFATGRLFRTFDFKLEYDFGSDVGLKDAYFEGARYTKRFLWRIGHFKEPFSLARQTSANDLAFMEWAAPVPTFSPGRNFGIMFRHSEASDHLFWAVSATTAGRVTDDNRTNSKISLTARVTGLPLLRDEGRRLVHIGGSYSVRNPDDNTVEFTSRPEARFVPFFVDTGPLDATTGNIGVLEFAVIHDALWVQAEWFVAGLESSSLDNPTLDGGYVEAGWFLTGESRFYVPAEGAFGRLTPTRLYRGGNPFQRNSDSGALEVVGRISSVDLDSGPVRGGRMRDFSVGLNWYLSQTQRVSVNYVHSHVIDSGRANLFLFRYQYNP